MKAESEQVTVLVTDAGYPQTLGAVRALARAGYRVDAIGQGKHVVRCSRYLTRIAYDDRRFTEEHFPEFLAFLRDAHYDVLLPIGAKSVLLAAAHLPEISQHCAVPLPSPAAIETCMDKLRVYQLALQQGVLAPRTWHITSSDDLEVVRQEAAFPVVLKGRYEVDPRPCHYVTAPEELSPAFTAWCAQGGEGAETLAQEYIQGEGCGFFGLYQHGELRRCFMHRRLREVPATGGASCCAESIFAQDLLDAGEALMAPLQWHGVVMVEFKRQRDTGTLYLMEINAKFWGSLDLAIAAGVNFPALAAQVALGEDVPRSCAYAVGLRYHWPFGDGELLHLRQRPRDWGAFLRDCLNPRVKSNVWYTDLLPTLRLALKDVAHLLGLGQRGR
ncbi:MAG TPA: ATP-grasp domain-containing protein [Armatimonadota bacterium]|jgi:predicted ATP-grasp superfamily ATP-dependent carboligase